jgi:hypothetical protein
LSALYATFNDGFDPLSLHDATKKRPRKRSPSGVFPYISSLMDKRRVSHTVFPWKEHINKIVRISSEVPRSTSERDESLQSDPNLYRTFPVSQKRLSRSSGWTWKILKLLQAVLSF